eukprot:6463891-Amphidinium_carterae.1
MSTGLLVEAPADSVESHLNTAIDEIQFCEPEAEGKGALVVQPVLERSTGDGPGPIQGGERKPDAKWAVIPSTSLRILGMPKAYQSMQHEIPDSSLSRAYDIGETSIRILPLSEHGWVMRNREAQSVSDSPLQTTCAVSIPLDA